MKYFTVEFLKNGLLRFFLKLSYENSATYEHFWVFSHFSVHRWRYFHMTIEEKILKVHFLKNSTVKYFNSNFFRTFRVPTLRFGGWFFLLITFYLNPFGRGVLYCQTYETNKPSYLIYYFSWIAFCASIIYSFEITNSFIFLFNRNEFITMINLLSPLI